MCHRRQHDDEIEITKELERTLDWKKPGRLEALFSQVISAGQKAFLSSDANLPATKDKPEEKYCIKDAWTNAQDGIMTMLKKHENFVGAPWPMTHDSLLNTVKRTLEKHKHLYTQGMEQAEPADAGTEGTKDERPLSSLEQAIVDVHSLMEAAKATTAKNKVAKGEAADRAAQAHANMQDAAVKKRYAGALPNAPKQRGARKRAAEALDEDDVDVDPTTGLAGTPRSTTIKYITVADYCAQHELDDEAEASILDGTKVPSGYKLIDPTHPDMRGKDVKFEEPYLEKMRSDSPPGNFRSRMLETFERRNEVKEFDLRVKDKEADVEKIKAETERKRVETQQATQQAMAAQQAQFMQMMQEFMKRMPMPPPS